MGMTNNSLIIELRSERNTSSHSISTSELREYIECNLEFKACSFPLWNCDGEL